MTKHPETLKDTAIWQAYLQEVQPDSERCKWIENVFKTAVEHLKAVRDTFPNYTLHDETHILNVIAAMDGILGNKVDKLSIGELELLILAASLHDIGMVYSNTEKESAINNKKRREAFLREHCPELMGCPYEEWPEDTQQWYLRKLHPFRVSEVLNRTAWQELFRTRPAEIVPEQCIIAVCQAHGEEPDSLKKNNLSFLKARNTDPLFCALLLRLADLLDFDDTRAPKVLLSYATNNEKSFEEWKKHMDSVGFSYPLSPSNDDLPYIAECTDPRIEHAVHDFLNWIDDELTICAKLQVLCEKDWQRKFPFPRKVSRDEITSTGYKSGDFRLTMDQVQILKLLSGEHLYSSNDVFIRELLQNAVDATLLRSEMDPSFLLENAQIDLWEWNDKDGNVWFRIDDKGTGMTIGMLQRYFLKVGNSYYTSKELIRDLRDHGNTGEYQGISRFGIGFLSCFLCGTYAEVSTLYFDEKKSIEESNIRHRDGQNYGLRIEVTGLTGYYTLRNEAENHNGGLPLPSHPSINDDNMYRSEPGTSIVIRLDPGKLGTINLKKATERFICGTRMPIFYNGERIGRTYAEIMAEVHKIESEKIYELQETDKRKFDEIFPKAAGKYPRIVSSLFSLDSGKFHVLPGLSGILLRYDVQLDDHMQWQVKDQTYTVAASISRIHGSPTLYLQEENIKGSASYFYGSWKRLEHQYGVKNTEALKSEFVKLPACPASAEQLGDTWIPFSEKEDLLIVWRAYLNHEQDGKLYITLRERDFLTINELTLNNDIDEIPCFYHGILAGIFGRPAGYYGGQYRYSTDALFLIENGWQPTVDTGRTRISAMPLETLLSICGILYNPEITMPIEFLWIDSLDNIPLPRWRAIRDTELGSWLWNTQEERVNTILQTLSDPIILNSGGEDICISGWGDQCVGILYRYLMAYFQDTYEMTIDYTKLQAISFRKKNISSGKDYDLFPPMMFCIAANEESKGILCSADSIYRRGITADHVFTEWLIKNAVIMEHYFNRQFQQIISSLIKSDANSIIQVVNSFREQLLALPERHNINITALKPLSMNDFWRTDD